MELPLKELSGLLNNGQHILIVGPTDPNIDVICSAAAWQTFLINQKKQADVVMIGGKSDLKFLPSTFTLTDTISDLNKFKIKLDVTKTKVKQLSYDINDSELVIDIVPEGGVFSGNDLKAETGDYKYNLILALGAIDLESLGSVYQDNRHFFEQVPIINIDRQILNENFGQLNIIDPKATSIAEISYYALQKHLTKDLATCILGGMIAATNSFQSMQVTPQVLELASLLLIKGAERQQIIEALYRTKDIKTLKNWGKVLSRLQKQDAIISSYLQHNEAEALPMDLQELVRDLILSTPNVLVATIFYQLDFSKTEVWLYTASNVNALDLSKDLAATGNRRFVRFIVEKDLENTRQLVVNGLQEKLKLLHTF